MFGLVSTFQHFPQRADLLFLQFPQAGSLTHGLLWVCGFPEQHISTSYYQGVGTHQPALLTEAFTPLALARGQTTAAFLIELY